MEMPDVLTVTKEYLDQLAEDDAFEVPDGLRESLGQVAVEAREELACND